MRDGTKGAPDSARKFKGIERGEGGFEPPVGWRIDVLAGQQAVTGRGGFVVAVLHFGPMAFFALQLGGGIEVS